MAIDEVTEQPEELLVQTGETLVLDDPSTVVEPPENNDHFLWMPGWARFVVIGLMVVLALISEFPLRDYFSTTAPYEGVIQTLDEKKGNVTALVATCTAASAGISAIPGDAGTPVAEKLMDLSSSLMIVLAVIYLEKYLLTIFGLATFGLIVPVVCALVAAWALFWGRTQASYTCARLARKLIALGVVLMVTVPTSVLVTNMIDQTYADSLVIEEAQQTEEDAPAEEESGGFDPLKWLSDTAGAIQNGIESITTGMLDQVNNLIEGLAVMIVTSCLIPVIVLVFFLWMANLILGINIDAPMNALKTRGQRLAFRPRGRNKPAKAIAKQEG